MNIEVETYDQVLDRIASELGQGELVCEMKVDDLRNAAKLIRELVAHNRMLVDAARTAVAQLSPCSVDVVIKPDAEPFAIRLCREALAWEPPKVTS